MIIMWPFVLDKIRKQGKSAVLTEKIDAVAWSSVGRVRENNEDNYLLGQHYNVNSEAESSFRLYAEDNLLAGVFDGMGGGEAGELASLSASRIFSETAKAIQKTAVRQEIDQQLRAAFRDANNAVVDLQKQCRVLGTTGTVVYCRNNQYKVYHLGDSRAYLFREGLLHRLTRDQTLAQMKMELGLYGENDAEIETEKHQLTEYIGRDWTRESIFPVENAWEQLVPGDILLLCSDGLYDCCSDAEFVEILVRERRPESAAEELIKKANDHGGIDNITVVLLYYSFGE